MEPQFRIVGIPWADGGRRGAGWRQPGRPRRDAHPLPGRCRGAPGAGPALDTQQTGSYPQRRPHV